MRTLLSFACFFVLAATLPLACGSGEDPVNQGSGREQEPPTRTPVATGPAGGVAKPPAAFATAPGGARVALGIGTYCWSEPGKTGLCIDAVGPVTGVQALIVTRGGTVSVPNPVQGSVIQKGAVNSWPANGPPLTSSATEMVWSFQPGTGTGLVGLISAGGIDIVADLPPGRYALDIRLVFASGDVSYGLLLQVQ